MAILFLVIVHPILILAADNFPFFPFEKRYWPEFLGIGVLVVILVIVSTATLRVMFHLTYDKWRRFHRFGTPVTITLMVVHILFVSETFTSGIPQTIVLVAAGLFLLLLSRIWFRRFFPGQRRFVVSTVKPAGIDAYSVDVRSHNGQLLDYIPGQFAFITPISGNVPREEHQFTLSSTPSQPAALQFVIRALGVWKCKSNRFKAGAMV